MGIHDSDMDKNFFIILCEIRNGFKFIKTYIYIRIIKCFLLKRFTRDLIKMGPALMAPFSGKLCCNCRVSWQRYCRETEAGKQKLYSIFTFSVTASLIVWFLLKAPSKCCKSCIHILLATWYGQGFMDKQCFYWCTTRFSKCSSETPWCVSMFQEITSEYHFSCSCQTYLDIGVPSCEKYDDSERGISILDDLVRLLTN